LGYQEHPWVTANGADPLLSYDENTAQIIEPPTEEEMNLAITKNMGHLLTVVCIGLGVIACRVTF
jgi:[calcium/calmodulin-dependent protein kinase] kinase